MANNEQLPRYTVNDYLGMKLAWKQGMYRIWGPNGRLMSPTQIRGLLRVFCLGWCESMVVNKCPIEEWHRIYGEILNNNDWYPDESWNWWDDPRAILNDGSGLILPTT